MKKIMAVVLAGCMCLGMSTFAFASETTSEADRGEIVISGLNENETVTAYQIAVGKYEGEFVGYEMLYDGTGYTIDQYGNCTPDDESLKEGDLSALFTAASGTVYKTATADANGDATFSDMEVGAYLFVVTGSESTVYGMVIGSVYYAVDETTGEWAVVDGEVDVQGSHNWIKASEPQIEKTVTGGSLEDYEHGGSADLGDTLEYHITVGPIVSYEGEYPQFVVTDTISSKLTITDDEFADLTVKVVEENGDVVATLTSDDYVLTRTEDGFTVDFVVEGKYTLNEYVGKSLLIDFSADVTSADGTADSDDHLNEADLDYASTSYVSGQSVEKSDSTHNYTFNAKIQKVDQDDEALSGAQFTLFTDEACAEAYQRDDSDYTVTSDSDGYFEFVGLEEGEYWLKETKAPYGYALNTNLYKITISANYNEDGTIVTGYTVNVTDETNNEPVGNAIVSTTNATISNTKIGSLPSMGGRGTLIFTLVGCGIVCGAAVGIVARRKTA